MATDTPGGSGMSTQPKPRLTPAEYLAAERRAETKSEYYAGEVFPMPGASKRHNLITTNLIVSLGTQVRERACEVYPPDMRVKVERGGLYTYPDVAVVCGFAQLEDEELDTLLNPTLLVEVLSESTERYDRGRKAEHYRRIESLREYLFVSQSEPRVERYQRQGAHEWLLSEFCGLDERVELASIGCSLVLRDVYHKVLPADSGPA